MPLTVESAVVGGCCTLGLGMGGAVMALPIRDFGLPNVVENAAARGDQLYVGLLDLKTKYEVIGDVRGGRGLMLALELVDNHEEKSAAPAKASRMQKVAYDAGAMVRASGPNIIISPPPSCPF